MRLHRHVMLTAALCLLSIPVAAQGLIWESVVHGEQMGEMKEECAYMPGMFRVVQATKSGETLIFRLDTKMLYLLDPSEKKYKSITFDEMEQQMKKMGRVVDKQMAELSKQLEQMSPDERALIEKQMGGLMSAKGRDNSVSVKKGGEKKTIAGYATEKFVAMRDGKPILTTWVTKGVPGWAGMKKDFEAYVKLSGANLLAGGIGDALGKVDGFPMQMEMMGMTSVVTRVEARTTSREAFEIPSGYTKDPTPLFDAGMRGE